MDLSDLWRGSLSVRRAGVLLLHLPPDAAVYRVGPDDALWSLERQGLANVEDTLVSLFAKNGSPAKRPGDKRRQRELMDWIFAKAKLHRERAAARRRAREQGV